MFRRTLLGAVLEDASGLLDCRAERPILIDADAEGLFDVDVLAGLDGANGERHVPVIGSCDDDGVDVLAFEHLPEVGVFVDGFEGGLIAAGGVEVLDLFRAFLLAVLEAGVADGDALAIRLGEENDLIRPSPPRIPTPIKATVMRSFAPRTKPVKRLVVSYGRRALKKGPAGIHRVTPVSEVAGLLDAFDRKVEGAVSDRIPLRASFRRRKRWCR